jgi:hypothetical protein
MDWGTILFVIVMLHLVVGFGYAFYKIEYGGKKKNSDTNTENQK